MCLCTSATISLKVTEKNYFKSVGKFWMDTSSDNLLSNSLVKIYNFIFCRMLRNALGVETVTKKYPGKGNRKWCGKF